MRWCVNQFSMGQGSCGVKRSDKIMTTGFALFAMFFGAGNMVFPLFLGANAGHHLLLVALVFVVVGVGGWAPRWSWAIRGAPLCCLAWISMHPLAGTQQLSTLAPQLALHALQGVGVAKVSIHDAVPALLDAHLPCDALCQHNAGAPSARVASLLLSPVRHIATDALLGMSVVQHHT